MPDQEPITLEVDPGGVLTAIRQANEAVEGWEKKVIGSGDKMQESLERMADMLLKNQRPVPQFDGAPHPIHRTASGRLWEDAHRAHDPFLKESDFFRTTPTVVCGCR